MSKRFAILVLFGLALLVPASSAGAADSVPGGGGNGSVVTGGGGGGGGTVYYWDLKGTGSGQSIKIPKGFRWGSPLREKGGQRRYSVANIRFANKLTKKLMKPCSGGRGKGCVLWGDELNSFRGWGDTGAWEIHSRVIDRMIFSSMGVGANFSVKVWRENTSNNTLQLVFQRRVGGANGCKLGRKAIVCENAYTDPPGTRSTSQIQRNWWYGGSEKGAYFSKQKDSKAGPIGSPTGSMNQACSRSWSGRWNNGKKSDAAIKDDYKLVRSGKNVNDANSNELGPRSLGGGFNTCYWDDTSFSPRFSWNNSGKQVAESLSRDNYRLNGKPLPANQWGQPLPLKAVGDKQLSPNLMGVAGTGTKEAISFSWRLGGDAGKSDKVKLSVQSAPGLIYAMQVVRIDDREQILPLKDKTKGITRNTYWPGWGKGAPAKKAQLFRAFINRPLPPGPVVRCNDNPQATDECTFDNPQPTPEMTLAGPDTVSVMEPANYQATLSAVNAPIGTTIFTSGIEINHFTPQADYGTAEGGNLFQHVDYDRNPDFSPTAPENIISNDGLRPSGDWRVNQFSSATSGVPEPIVTSNGGSTDVFDLTATWSSPSPENPCAVIRSYISNNDVGGPTAEWGSHNAGRLWPKIPRLTNIQNRNALEEQCHKYYNVWDELFYSKASWQTTWENDVWNPNKPSYFTVETPGLIALRCGLPGSGSLQSCSGSRRKNYMIPAISGSSGKKIQGAINRVAGEKTPLRAQLEAADPNNKQREVYPGPVQAQVDGSSLQQIDINTLTGEYELNRCREGAPADSKLVGGPANWGTSVSAADPYCAGYTMRWRWVPVSRGGKCLARKPRSIAPPKLEDLVANPDGYSTAGSYPEDVAKKNEDLYYKTGSYREAGVPLGSAPGDPYSGYLPSEKKGYKSCGKNLYLQTGYWTTDYENTSDWNEAHAGFGKNNNGDRLPASTSGTSIVTFTFTEPVYAGIRAAWRGPNHQLYYSNGESYDYLPVRVLAPAPTR